MSAEAFSWRKAVTPSDDSQVYLKIDTLVSCGGVTLHWPAMTSGSAAAASVLRIIQWLLFSCEIQIKLRQLGPFTKGRPQTESVGFNVGRSIARENSEFHSSESRG